MVLLVGTVTQLSVQLDYMAKWRRDCHEGEGEDEGEGVVIRG